MAHPPDQKNGSRHFPLPDGALSNNKKTHVLPGNHPGGIHGAIFDKVEEDKEKTVERISKAIDSYVCDAEKLEIFETALRNSQAFSKSALFGKALNFRARNRLLDAVWRDPNRITVKDPESGENCRITIGKDGDGKIRVIFYDRRGKNIKINDHRLAYDDERIIYEHGQ